MTPPRLPQRQQDALTFIASFERDHGFAPSLRDICTGLNITSTNGANDHLHALERKGLLDRKPNTARSLQVTAAGLAVLGLQKCPTCGRAD